MVWRRALSHAAFSARSRSLDALSCSTSPEAAPAPIMPCMVFSYSASTCWSVCCSWRACSYLAVISRSLASSAAASLEAAAAGERPTGVAAAGAAVRAAEVGRAVGAASGVDGTARFSISFEDAAERTAGDDAAGAAGDAAAADATAIDGALPHVAVSRAWRSRPPP